ncbi:MAG: heparinase II/III family protein [Oscillospiraceae bacterium]|nr:heparinase II/III family protein [Oscillospiraceae bacterium]
MKFKRLLSLLVAITMVLSLFGAFTITTEAATMDEATFFAKLNYSAYPALSAVKAAADRRDYETAKIELLKYYKERIKTTKLGFGISEADENYGMAVLPMRNILTGPNEFDMWQAEFAVESSDFSTYNIDVTERIAHEQSNGAVSFMLFAGDKQRYPVYVQSKESDAPPVLVIEYEKNGVPKAVTITADNDTYISSQNTGTAYGGEAQLVIKEDDAASNNSTGDNTRRAYINFPLKEAANSTIISATLQLSAAYSEDCDTGEKDVLVINVGDTMWSENSLTWGGITHSIYSYQNLQNPIWGASAPGADSEYHNVTARFWYGRPMAWEYLSYLNDPEEYNNSHPYAGVYPGEEFGPKLVELMSAFATQMRYGYNRTLETGERLNRWVDIVDAFLATNVFDDHVDEFYNILTYMWGDCNYLYGLDIANGSYWWSNWRIVANAGFFKATEFLYELKDHDNFRNKAEYNVEYTIDLLYNDDMSFTEAGPSYSQWCVQLFADCAIMADKAGNPMSAEFVSRLRYAAHDAMYSFFPDGYESNVGDSSYKSNMPQFKRLAEFLNDPELTAYVNGDGSYTEGLTHFSDSVNSAYMRTSWDPRETSYLSFVNSPNDGHAHPDSNQVIMYAYGQPLLVDSGRYSYSSTNKIYDELRWARAHNVVEADGVTMGTHSASAEKFSVWADNALFNFATSGQHGYPNTKHTRNVMFLKDAGFAVVTDYVDGNNANQKYNQNWHFMPSSNAAVKGQNVETDFYGKANIILANADSDAEPSVKPGYFSADYGLVAASEYGSFSKTGADVKFGTVLYPVKAGETAAVTAKDIAADLSSSAIEFTIDGKTSALYVKNTDDATGEFGAYATDAKMAYISDSTVALVNGTRLTGSDIELDSPLTISDISVILEDGVLAISGSNLSPNTEDNAAKITAAGVTSVTLNGEEISFNEADGVIYAVGVASVTRVETVGTYTAEKDGFVASSYGNEGATYRDYIQAQAGWQNRNAYAAFDLKDIEIDDFSKAVIRMTVTEAAGGGDVHFYFLDYGDWTRDTLPFVLDSTKMPSHTANTGTYTGYAGHFSGSVSGIGVGSVFEVDITGALKDYMRGATTDPNVFVDPREPRFTFAMLSAAGSTKFASIENGIYPPGPTIILTNEVTEGETKDTFVTVNFVDKAGRELQEPVTITGGLTIGNFYSYSAPELITAEDGAVYALDTRASNIGTMIAEGENVLTAVYTEAAEINIVFTANGEPIANGDAQYVIPGTSYTFTPAVLYTFDGQDYLTDTEKSTLTVKAQQNAENTVTIALSAVTIKESLIENSGFDNGDATGWTTSNYTKQIVPGQDNFSVVEYKGHDSALRMNTNTGSANAGSLSTKFAVKPNTDYYFGLDILHDDGTATTGFLELMDKNNTNLRHIAGENPGQVWSGTGEYFPSKGEWSRVEYLFTTGENEEFVGIKAAWSASPVYLDNIVIYEIDSVPAESEPILIFDGKEAVANTETDCVLVIAQYDKDGILLDIKFVNVTAKVQSTLELTKVQGAVKATAFLWDSFSGMKPITEAISQDI